VLDYSKYKYEQAQKQKAARRHQQQITIREIKFRPKIAQNDYDTKKGHVSRFLKNKDKVKITIMFRGREVTHPERGTALLDRLAGELSELAVVEQSPVQDGRNMTMLLAPSKAVLAGAGEKDGKHEKPADDHEPRAETEPAESPDGEQAPADGEQAAADGEQAAADVEQPAADVEQPAANGEQPAAAAERSTADAQPEPEPVQAKSSTAA
ncbi:MAG TPA: translation initiation factor IF-3, partial [Solirubrobacteraceae bacterium]|nr:translation initiation factor IF-3 [Solirubrobacteraceae bacterium]